MKFDYKVEFTPDFLLDLEAIYDEVDAQEEFFNICMCELEHAVHRHYKVLKESDEYKTLKAERAEKLAAVQKMMAK